MMILKMGSWPNASGSLKLFAVRSPLGKSKDGKDSIDLPLHGLCSFKSVVLMKQSPEQQNQCMPFPPALAFVSDQVRLHSSAGTAAWPFDKTA